LKFKMKIERKFLIKEKEKIYPCPFPVEGLKKEIKSKGEKITQHYLPKEFSKEIFETLGFKTNFQTDKFRIRKYGKKYFITMKSSGKIKRHEKENRISKEIFEVLEKLKIKTLEKTRLIKNYKNKKIEFNYFPKHSLITAEIEFRSLSESKKFKTNMKEISGSKEYQNSVLTE